eukprot:10306575-Heterocapsa_arctica.AAC.1
MLLWRFCTSVALRLSRCSWVGSCRAGLHRSDRPTASISRTSSVCLKHRRRTPSTSLIGDASALTVGNVPPVRVRATLRKAT